MPGDSEPDLVGLISAVLYLTAGRPEHHHRRDADSGWAHLSVRAIPRRRRTLAQREGRHRRGAATWTAPEAGLVQTLG